MRIAILGTGGVGGYFGARLAEGGQEVHFVARGRHLEALTRDGLRLRSVSGDVDLTSVSASASVDPAFRPDLVIVCVKTWQLEQAIESMRPALTETSVVLPLLNGVEAGTQLAAALGPQHVMNGLCGLISFIEAPGVIRHAAVDPPFIKFGEIGNEKTDRVSEMLSVFENAPGISAEVPADIEAELWMKFLFISPISGVGAVTRSPMGVFRSQPESRELLRQAMQEICDLAIAKGIKMSPDAVEKTFVTIDGLPESGTSSMQRDLMNGVRSELEAQLGAVVRLGKAHDVATPANDFLYASLVPIERRARGELSFDA